MIIHSFTIPLYDVKVTLAQLEKGDTKRDIQKILSPLKDAINDEADEVFNSLQGGAVNGATTWRNMRLSFFVVTFYPMTNIIDRVNVFGHEKRHIEDRTLEWYSVEDIESAGLLAGFLSIQFYKFEKILDK